MPTRIQVAPKVVTGGPQPSVAITFPAPPAVNNSVVTAVWSNVNAAAPTVTDNRGNTHTLIASYADANIPETISLYLALVATSGAPFTITAAGGSTFRMIYALELTIAAVDKFTGQAGGFPTPASPGTTAALAGPTAFVLGMIGTPSSIITVDAGSPTWTQETEEVSSPVRGELDSRSVTGVAAQSLSWTLNGANFWVAAIVAFKDGTPPVVAVPDVKGKSHADAIAAIVAAGLAPGQVKKENSDKVPPGHVIRQDPEPPAQVPPGTPVDLVESGGAGNGLLPLGMLQGKVNAAHELLVSTSVPAARTASLDGDTAHLDTVLIPAPPPGARIVVTRLTVSAHVAGAFRVSFRHLADHVLGPIWLPGSGPLPVATDRVFATGPIRRALPPGSGLFVTTSADAPQSIDAEYVIVGDV